MSEHDKNKTEFESHEEELEWVLQELRDMYKKHGDAAYHYTDQKSKFEQMVRAHVVETAVSYAAAERHIQADGADGEKLYFGYKSNKSMMEGYDRRLKNLDIRRSIIQSLMKKDK